MDFIAGLNVTIYGLGIVFLALLVVMFSIMVLSRLLAVATGKDYMSAAPQRKEPAEEAAPAIDQLAPAAAAPAEALPPTASVFDMVIAGVRHNVEVQDAGETGWTVAVDGVPFQVRRDGADAKRVIVNGKPHTVVVRESLDGSTGVVIDGTAQSIQIIREKARATTALAVSAPAPGAPVSTPAPPTAAPAATPAPAAPRPSSGGTSRVTAPLPGKVLSIAVKAGDSIRKGEELCVIEAMKMGNSIKAQRDCVIQEVVVSVGDTVSFGAPLFNIG